MLATLVSGTTNSFYVEANYLPNFIPGRAVKCDLSGDGLVYSTISNSVFDNPNTVVTINDNILTANLIDVQWGTVKPGSTGNLALHSHDSNQLGGQITSTAVADWQEAVDESVNTLLVGAGIITLDYDDVGGTLTISGSPDDPDTHNHDARYYTETELNNGQLDNRYYTEEEVSTLSGTLQTDINGKSDTGHGHIESDISDLQAYVTETEFTTYSGTLQTQIDEKSDTGHEHVEANITDLDKYSQAEIAEELITFSGTIDHSTILNNHNLDTDIDHDQLTNFEAGEHFTEGSIDHTAIQNTGSTSHADIDNHVASGTLHREIDDGATGATDLWSGSYLESEFNDKSESDHEHARITNIVADIGEIALSGPTAINIIGGDAATKTEVTDALTLAITLSGSLDHFNLDNIGDYQHTSIDNHIEDANVHFTEGSIDHENITNVSTDQHHARKHTMTATVDHSAGTWKTFYSDGSGDVIELALGDTGGSYLRGGGFAAAPTWSYIQIGEIEGSENLATDEELLTTSGVLQNSIDGKSTTGHTHIETSITDLKDYLLAVNEDLNPGLGGNLDLNTYAIDFPTTSGISDCLDEDDMASDSATMLATQQSIKKYVDNEITTATGSLTVNHSELNELDYVSAGHTGFASSTLLTTTSGDLQTNINNLTHDGFADYVANEHIDWTNATENLFTTGTISGSNLYGDGSNLTGLIAAHNDLTGVTANQHHDENHYIDEHGAYPNGVYYSDESQVIQYLQIGEDDTFLMGNTYGQPPSWQTLTEAHISDLGDYATNAEVATVSGVLSGDLTTHVGLPDAHHNRSHAITSTADHAAGNWKTLYSDGSGDIQELALGAWGKCLVAKGTTGAPVYEFPTKLQHPNSANHYITITENGEEPYDYQIEFWCNGDQRARFNNNGSFGLENGTQINEFSIDGTMAGNSDDAVCTEAAIVTYVASNPGSYLKNVVEDSSPKIGGDLDTYGFMIYGGNNEYVLDLGGPPNLSIPDDKYFDIKHTDGTAYYRLDTRAGRGGDFHSFVSNSQEHLRVDNLGISLYNTYDNTVNAIHDEDNMASNDTNGLATQQSIKAYVDNTVAADVLSGQQSINNAVTSVDVSIGSTMGDTSYAVIVSLENVTDSPPSLYNYMITTKTTTQFTVTFGDEIDSANYYLNWYVTA